MTNQLHDLMHRDVRELNPDLTALTVAARRRGLSIRRRRQALSTLGTVGFVAVIAFGATQLPWVSRPAQPPAATPGSVLPSPTTPQTARASVPLTGEATTAGLRDALEDIAEGHSTHFAGQSSPEHVSRDTYGELRWHPADGSGFSDVGLNVQPGFAEVYIYRCRDWQVACTVTRSGGATLMTFEEVTRVADGEGIRVTADLLRADGVRVVASATNGHELPANKWQITRPRPAFTAQQLTRVISQPWWGPRVPGELQQEGKALPGYTDLNADIADRTDVSATPATPGS